MRFGSPNAIFDVHRDDPEFGYRFLVDEVQDLGWGADGVIAKRKAKSICGRSRIHGPTSSLDGPSIHG